MKLAKYLVVIPFIAFACKGGDGNKTASTETSETTTEVVAEDNTETHAAVCYYNSVGVRAEPKRKGKYLTSLSLGEDFIYLGETVVDTTVKEKHEYYKIKLSDETEAWARSYGILIDAKAATVISKTPVYTRPDLVNKTKNMLNVMEFVAIKTEKDDWVEFVSANRKKKGWVKKGKLSYDKKDIQISVLAHKSSIMDGSGNTIASKIPEFVEDLPYEDTKFKDFIDEILAEQVEEVIIESVEDYESDTDGETLEGI